MRKAESFVRNLLEQNAYADSFKLPTLRELAVRADVAPATMNRALRTFKERGEVVSKKAAGLYAGIAVKEGAFDTPPSRTNPRRFGKKWERVRDTLDSDLSRGVFPPGSLLPSLKELSARYGVGYRTLMKGVRELVESKRLRPTSQGYLFPRQALRSFQKRIVLVTVCDEDGRAVNLLPLRTLYVRELESRCRAAGVQLTVAGYDTFNDRILVQDPSFSLVKSKSDEGLYGFVVWMTGLALQQERRVFDRLLALRKPIAVLDELGVADWRAYQAHAGRIKVFDVSVGREAGEETARCLIRKGHRRVAFVSRRLDESWVQARLEGLHRRFALAGYSDAVRMCRPGGARDGRKSDVVDSLEALCRGKHASCWVAANDAEALECMRFLQQKRGNPWREIALASFDDSDDAVMNGITSYNANGVEALPAMIDHILYPARSRGRKVTVVKIPGFVSERASTAGPMRRKLS